jgi:hypothetical protein
LRTPSTPFTSFPLQLLSSLIIIHPQCTLFLSEWHAGAECVFCDHTTDDRQLWYFTQSFPNCRRFLVRRASQVFASGWKTSSDMIDVLAIRMFDWVVRQCIMNCELRIWMAYNI